MHLLSGDNLINPHGAFCFGIDPEEWIMPVVAELNLDQMSTFGTSRPVGFEDCIWA